MTARRRAAPTAPRSEHGGPGLAGARRPGPDLPRGLRLLLGSVLLLALLAGLPAAADAEEQFHVWQSPQFGLTLAFPITWNLTDQQSDPDRGDVAILGNDVSALLVGLLHDTRTPRQMADDLVMAQKLAERIRIVIAEEAMDLGDDSAKVTVSMGVTLGTAESDPEFLVAQADTAMYAAKRNGRNRIEVGLNLPESETLEIGTH